MMLFAKTAGGLLRALSLPALGSTNRTHEVGGSRGPSGADFFTAELELQPWPAALQPPITSTPSTPRQPTTITDYSAEQRVCDEFQLPEPPKSAVLRTRRETTPASSLVLRPISRAGSSDSKSSTSSIDSSGSNSSSEGEAGVARPPGNDATHRPSVRKKQQASQLCWREYWG
ncbi:hypothetical protein F4677DRAFT_352418 [Hypoxylon crocopeplum]|nr:hypothetical protein F4677DRAFT_352418 [Hypoxylon crocopeplum]